MNLELTHDQGLSRLAVAADGPNNRRLAIAGLVLGLLLAAGCGGTSEPSSSTTGMTDASSDETTTTQHSSSTTRVTDASSAETTTTASDVLASPTVEGMFEVADGRQLHLTCWGEGSPTVVLESGHPDAAGITDFGVSGAFFTRAIAEDTQVCAYGRAGWDGSDPAPNQARTADDVIDDLHNLLGAAGVEGPYVMVGSSFGGMVVTYYAATYPDDVVGVVLLDVPAPSATLSEAEIPEVAWDHSTNLEHLDIVPEFESRFATDPVSFPAPLTVITATQGDTNVENQAVWRQASPDARQIKLNGGHDIYVSYPDATAAEVLALVQRQQ